jgi:hypothetical protein
MGGTGARTAAGAAAASCPAAGSFAVFPDPQAARTATAINTMLAAGALFKMALVIMFFS